MTRTIIKRKKDNSEFIFEGTPHNYKQSKEQVLNYIDSGYKVKVKMYEEGSFRTNTLVIYGEGNDRYLTTTPDEHKINLTDLPTY